VQKQRFGFSVVFRAGDDCPRTFADIMKKLTAAEEQDGVSCQNRRTMLVSETAQALGEATSYRSVTALDCEQPEPSIVPEGFGRGDVGVLFSLFGLQAGGGMPVNVEIIAFDKSTGVFNYYETDGNKINFFGNSKDLLTKGTGSGGDRRCAACHTGGGLIMKELSAPWLHWEGDTDTPGADELISANEELLGDHSDGIDMEDIVRAGNRDWNRMRIEFLKEIGATQEILRPLFCTVEVNIESAESFDNGTAEGIATFASMSGTVFNGRLGFGALDFDSEQYDGLIRANGQVLRGLPAGNIETVFGLTTVVPGEADMDYVRALVNAGIIDDEFVEDVLSVDFTRAVFSDDRCDLLANVPGVPSSDLSPQTLRAAILDRLGETTPGTPEAELKNNLANPNDDIRARIRAFSDACQGRGDTESITFSKDGSSQTLDVPSVLVDYMKIVSLNRNTATGLPVFEFPQTMPSDDQNIAAGTRFHPTDCTITNQFVAVAEEFDAGATCFERCGEEAPSGCSCAANCASNGNCCDDVLDHCEAADCGHGLCEEGDKLVASCQDQSLPGDCAAQVCDEDSFCCDVAWNQFCVEKVVSVCGLTCEPNGGTCCKTCGPNSKACGDSCIPNANNCNTEPGCACDS